MMIKSFFGMIMKDFWEKKLVPLKLIYFLRSAAMLVLYPYLTLYKREFLVAFIVPPLAGLLADRIGNFKPLLSLLSALGGIGALLLLFMPIGRSTIVYPQNLVLTTSNCDSNASVFEIHPRFSCDTIPNAKTTLTLESCGYACTVDSLNNDSYIQNILDFRSYKLIEKGLVLDQTNITDKSESKVVHNVSNTFYLQNVTEYSTIAVRQISKDVYFFSAEERLHSDIRLSTSLRTIDETVNGHRYLAEDIECMLVTDEVMKTASVEVMIDDEVVKIDGCYESCVYVAPRRDVCSNMKVIIEYNPKLTFWMYLGIRVFMCILNVATITMFESPVIAILRREKADCGLQKIYGIIAGMMVSPLSGMLIDYASHDKGYLDFRPAFYLHAALKILTGFVMLTIDLDFKKPTPNITSVVIKMLRNVEMTVLLITFCTIMGSIKSFFFWSLEGLRESRSLIAISMICGAIAGFIFLLMSGQIINAIGHAKFIFVSFILYTITLFGYSLIYEPGLYPIFEALESATTSLSSVAVVTYAGKLFTWMTDASIQGLLRSLYLGVGNGSGSLIGRCLMELVGIRTTYQIFGVVALIMSLGYLWFNLFYLMKQGQDKKLDVTEKEYNKSNTEGYW